MMIKLINNVKTLTSFLKTQPHAELLQSPLWGAVQKAHARRLFYWGAFDNDVLVGACLIIKHPLPFGKCWFYSPRPIIKNKAHYGGFISHISNRAREEHAVFWKIEGVDQKQLSPDNQNNQYPSSTSLRASTPLQYPETLLLDLTKTIDQLLAKMKQKTRYNIRLAEKRGVTTKWSFNRTPTDRVSFLNTFYDLLKKTATRQNITIHSKEHYEHILNILGREKAVAIAIAYYKKTPLAANLITFFGDTAVYLHGGTSDEHKNLMAPYLLQLEAIQEAQRRGCSWYDLGGVAITKGKQAHWAGITRFKTGFGGTLYQFGTTYDIVFRKFWYALYRLKQKTRT